jgi:pimeloyl-ACP methyl ester carboxylesterase
MVIAVLYVHESGSPAAPAIVFLHGAGLSGRAWQPQFERLPDYYCLAPDLPEQGRSVHEGPFTLDGAARAVAGIIRERIPGGKAHVVGLSLGGAVALTMLGLVPELLDHVMVTGTAAGLGRGLGTLTAFSGSLYRFMSAERLIDMSAKSFAIPDKYRAMFREDMLLTSNAAFTRHIAQALMTMQLPSATKAPLLVMVGARETITAKQAARKLVRTLPGARGVLVPGVGHVWNLQAPNLFTATIRAWITDRSLPSVLRSLQ